jgi:hypothetical protein
MAAMELPVAWYVYRAGHRHGPMPSIELALLAKTNVLQHSDLIWCDGLPDWVEAGGVSGLLSPSEAPQPKFSAVTQAYLDSRSRAGKWNQRPADRQSAASAAPAHASVTTANDKSTGQAGRTIRPPMGRGRSAPLLQLEIAAAPAM